MKPGSTVRTLIHCFQLHPALALARSLGGGVAPAGSATITEMDTRSRQIHPFDRLAAGTFRRVVGIHPLASTPFLALAKDSFASLNLKNMPPFQGVATSTFSSRRTHRVALASGSTIAGI